MVVVNLYPFDKTVQSLDCTFEMGRTNIDIGGPCMLRASAKNFLRVLSLCNPDDYQHIIKELKSNGGEISLPTRFEMAKKCFGHTAEYDKNIFTFFGESFSDDLLKCYKEGDL